MPEIQLPEITLIDDGEACDVDDSSFLDLYSDSIAPEHSASQTTQSFQPINIPGCLKPINNHIIFEAMNKEEFVEWWLRTSAGQAEDARVWDTKGCRADIWASFDQVAHCVTGKPMMMCKRCGAILHHPNAISRSSKSAHGTTALRRHLTRQTCQARGQAQGKGSHLQRLLRHQVRTFFSSRKTI